MAANTLSRPEPGDRVRIRTRHWGEQDGWVVSETRYPWCPGANTFTVLSDAGRLHQVPDLGYHNLLSKGVSENVDASAYLYLRRLASEHPGPWRPRLKAFQAGTYHPFKPVGA